MKFQAETGLLENSLSRMDTIVPARDTQTLLANILLTIGKDKVSITASDMESTARISIPAENTTAGELIINARKFTEIARKINSEQFSFSAESGEENNPEGSLQINVSGTDNRAARFKLGGSARSHFPDLTHVSPDKLGSVSSKLLEEMIRKTFYAISQEDNRYIYNGISFQTEGSRLTLVGTDGRRLSAITREIPSPVSLNNDASDIVVHAKAIKELLRLLDADEELKLGIDQRNIFFSIGNCELSSRLLEGRFPDYRKVIPREIKIEIEVVRETLIKAIEQIKVMTELPSNQIKLTLEKDSIKMRAHTPDVGEAEINLPVKYSGDEISIAFNAAYMVDVLKSISCMIVKLQFVDSDRPIIIKDTEDPDFIALVMPMKI